MKKTMKERFNSASLATKISLGVVGGTVAVLFFIFMCFLFGIFIQFLWNATLVQLFGFPTISYWQAIGLFILAKFFFGFGGGGGNQGNKNKKTNMNDFCKEALTDLDGKPFKQEPTDDESQLSEKLSFKKFWEEEGKEAYQAYLASKNSDENDTKQSS